MARWSKLIDGQSRVLVVDEDSPGVVHVPTEVVEQQLLDAGWAPAVDGEAGA
jgi:hypothetical protein